MLSTSCKGPLIDFRSAKISLLWFQRTLKGAQHLAGLGSLIWKKKCLHLMLSESLWFGNQVESLTKSAILVTSPVLLVGFSQAEYTVCAAFSSVFLLLPLYPKVQRVKTTHINAKQTISNVRGKIRLALFSLDKGSGQSLFYLYEFVLLSLE